MKKLLTILDGFMKKTLPVIYAIIVIEVLCIATLSALGGFRQKPMLGEQINRAHQLGDPVGAWFFLEGSGPTVFDLSGGNTGTFVSAVTWGAGKYGSALNFAGADDYVNLGSWNNPSGKCSFIASVRFDEAIGVSEQIVSADKTDVVAQRSLQFRRSVAGKLELITWTGDVAKIITGDTTLTTGQRWHVAGVCDGVNNHVYVNGIEDAVPVASGLMDNDTGVAFLFGARDKSGDLSDIREELQGQIDFIIRWNRALSASEIALIYREPFCMSEKDDVALMAVQAPTGGQVIIITGMIPLLFALILMRRRNGQGRTAN